MTPAPTRKRVRNGKGINSAMGPRLRGAGGGSPRPGCCSTRPGTEPSGVPRDTQLLDVKPHRPRVRGDKVTQHSRGDPDWCRWCDRSQRAAGRSRWDTRARPSRSPHFPGPWITHLHQRDRLVFPEELVLPLKTLISLPTSFPSYLTYISPSKSSFPSITPQTIPLPPLCLHISNICRCITLPV